MPARKRSRSAKVKSAASALAGSRVERHDLFKTPSRIYDIEAPASKRDPKAIADAYVKQLAPTLKVDPGDLEFDR